MTQGTAPAAVDASDGGALAAPQDLRRQLQAQQAVAQHDVTAWLQKHPNGRKRAFISFAIQDLGAPPPARVQASELSYLRQLKARRTPAGIVAANLLDQHGKLDIWNQYAKQLPNGGSFHEQLTTLQKLLKRATDDAKTSYSRPGPRVAEPDLAPGAFDPTKTSYPSSHAAFAYAQAALLSTDDPKQADTFLTKAAEIAFSRLYVAGHYPSDLLAGAKLGFLLEAYVHDKA